MTEDTTHPLLGKLVVDGEPIFPNSVKRETILQTMHPCEIINESDVWFAICETKKGTWQVTLDKDQRVKSVARF